jgi:hypothetical protein
MAEHLARELTTMSDGTAPVIDRAVLGHCAWMLRDLIDRETRVFDMQRQQTHEWTHG